MDDVETERLSRLAGVPDFVEWQRQHVDAESRMARLLAGGVRDAWNACLPVWKSLGRANDLSRGIRVPKYLQSFATRLGHAFVDRYEDSGFLISVLDEFKVQSTEYLIAYDLLELMAIVPEGPHEFGNIFSLDLPIPPVILAELRGLSEFEDIEPQTVGRLLQRVYEVQWGQDE